MASIEEIIFIPGDLVQYFGPPILNPQRWDLIVSSDNGIINSNEIGVILETDKLLRIADVFFQTNQVVVQRITFNRLKYVK